MESETFKTLKKFIRRTEEMRDDFYKLENKFSETEAMYAQKMIDNSLKCFVALLAEKEEEKRYDLLGSLFLDSANIARKRLERMSQ